MTNLKKILQPYLQRAKHSIEQSKKNKEKRSKISKDLILDLSVEKLSWTSSNPFSSVIWQGLDKNLTKTEITKGLKKKLRIKPGDASNNCSREIHIARICWLVENWNDSHPIEIDFGIPSHNVYLEVLDGHHRLAAAIYKNKKTIKVNCCGSLEEIEFYKID